MINAGHAHHVTGTALANTEFGTKTVGSPTTTTVAAAPSAAQIQRRAGQARRTVPTEGDLPAIVRSSRVGSMGADQRFRIADCWRAVKALSGG